MTARLDSQSLRRCFSTLGCVDLALPEICALAAEFQVQGLELRGIGGRMDMPEHCAEQGLGPATIEKLCKRSRVQLVAAGSSAKLTSASDTDRAELLDLGAWADRLNIPYVRVFGGGTWGKPLRESEYAHAVELLNWWRTEKAALDWRVELLLETHDAFSGSAPCLELNRRLEQPLNLIWDSHHTWRVGGEAPGATWQRLGKFVRHVQVKDSVDRPSSRHPYTYVLPGDGQAPLADIMAELRRAGFDGFISLEWERHWHPYLPPLREALARLQERAWFTPTICDRQ
jgi:sugar phosphate isomerase/epimerase